MNCVGAAATRKLRCACELTFVETCGGLLGCGVAGAASQNRSQVMSQVMPCYIEILTKTGHL